MYEGEEAHGGTMLNNALNAWHRVDTFRFDVPCCSI